MNEIQFQYQIRRLQEQFGNQNYSQERIKLIWREVKDIEPFWFEKTVDRFIGECRQAPLLPEFRDAIAVLRETHRPKQSFGPANIETVSSCSNCKGNGIFVCGLKEASGLWAFRCHCSLGERDQRKLIPQFKREHLDQGFYYIDVKAR